MPPQEFSFRLQKGITGGFALPTPDHIFTVTKGPSFSPSENNTLQITAAIREVGTPSIESFGPAKVVDVDEEKSRLIDRLYEILQSLPTGGKEGYPTADIYGLDIGIMWEGAGLSWANSGPEGCGQGGFEEGASADQKTAFREAVDIVNAIVGFDKEKNQLRG